MLLAEFEPEESAVYDALGHDVAIALEFSQSYLVACCERTLTSLAASAV
jgi:hypothetical protein